MAEVARIANVQKGAEIMNNTYNQISRDKRKQFPDELLAEWERVTKELREVGKRKEGAKK